MSIKYTQKKKNTNHKRKRTMSFCSTTCTPDISATTLNISLIPTFLQGMTTAQQLAFIQASTKAARVFRDQVAKFYGKIANAKSQLSKRRAVCPLKIPWSVSNPPLIVNQNSQAGYYNFFIGSRTGFAYIMGAVLNYFRNQRDCNQRLSDGQATCQC
jgi:hypothetical protein